MPEEIKFIDNSETPKLNENVSTSEIKPIENIVKEETSKPGKKVTLPSWNIEPPVEIQRNVK